MTNNISTFLCKNDELPETITNILKLRDGSVKLIDKLTNIFTSEIINSEARARRTWELIGLYYLNNNRPHEALSIYTALYNTLLDAQEKINNQIHKGMP